MQTRRRAIAVALTALGTVAVAVPAGAQAATPAARSTSHVLRADVQISRFVVTKAGLGALGTASARLAGEGARRRVTFSVTKGSTCSILTLNLQQLNLRLLGLDLTTSAINLRITGNTGQTLGRLFCRLATGIRLSKAVSARKAAASLNRALRRHPMHAIRLRARLPVVTAQAAQAPTTCKVLDLVLGPLNLNLLGLVVDLYGADRTKPVEVHVTADPAGGVLGGVFCKLANGQATG